MPYAALATDYDDTLACEGRVDASTIAALERARAAGLRLLMVTGRVLPDLFATFPQYPLFHHIVGENGAVSYEPSTGAQRRLAEAPPAVLLDALARANVPVFVGESIVATYEAYHDAVREAIRDLDLDWHVIFNKGSVMALPANVTKATGLAHALEALGLTSAEIVGIGDAENDEAFLQACGVGVAVSNALPSLKDLADFVTAGARGAGVTELIDRLIAGDLAALDTPRR
jgi:hydroxymethylpyrimidine pyrophosphatase-like HAD family hydrolase